MVRNFSISQNTMQTFFRVYCDHSFLSPSILTNIPKFASAPSEKQNREKISYDRKDYQIV